MALPSWVPDGETKPAPMPLLLLQSLVNTWEGDSDTDLLIEPGSARQWLADTGLLVADRTPTHEDLAAARALRESIRALLVHNAGGPHPTAEELGGLSTAAESCLLRPRLIGPGRVELESRTNAAPLDIGRLLVIMRDSQRDGTWSRLKACGNTDCRWAYFDRSRAGRGMWCDMAVCGNRMKNRSLRSRKSAARNAREPEPAGG
jgi:predicted RNA-binding Zn ribbon-like protein